MAEVFDPNKYSTVSASKVSVFDPTKYKTTALDNSSRSNLEGYNLNIDIDRYKKYVKSIYPEALEREATTNQSNWQKTGNAIVQGIGGEVLAQGIIGGLGGLLELPKTIYDELHHKDADFSNFMTKFADNISEELQNTNPIFQYNPGKSFDWKDYGWWMSNAPSVFSSIGMLLPALGEVKIASWMSKGLNKLAALSRLNKMSGTSKAFTAVSDIFNTEKYWQELTHSAIVMRNAENMRESSGVFNTVKTDAFNSFQDEKTYQDALNSPIGEEFKNDGGKNGRVINKLEFANFIASKSAWKDYTINAGNLAFDMMQLAPLFRGHRIRTREFVNPAKVIAAQTAILTGEVVKPSKFISASSFLRGSAIMIGEQVSEGAEELVNAIAQSDGDWYGKHLVNGTKDEKFGNRLETYLKDPSSWEQAFWGFTGGVAFSGVTRAIRTAKDAINETKDPHSTEQKVEEVKNRFVIIGEYKRRMDLVKNGKHPQTGENFVGTPEEIEVAKSNLLTRLEIEQGYDLGLNASRHGNVGLLIDMIEHPGFKKTMVDNGMTDETNYDKTLVRLKDNILDAEKTYKQVYDKIFTATSEKPYLREVILGQAVKQKAFINHYKELSDITRTKIASLKTNNSAYESLKDKNKDNDFEGTLNNIINTRVADIIDQEVDSIDDEDVKNVMQEKATKLKEEIKVSHTDLKGKKAIGDFNPIEDIISAEADARIYDIVISGENHKFEEMVDTKKAVSKADNYVKLESAKIKEQNFQIFRKTLDDKTKVIKEDTFETIDGKIKIIDDYIKDITDNNHDPLLEKDDSFKKLDDNGKKRYIDTLENTKKRLNQIKNNRSTQEAVVTSLKIENETVVTNLSKAFKELKVNTPVAFTGKRHSIYSKFIEDMLKHSSNPVATLNDYINGKEVDEALKTQLTGFFNQFLTKSTTEGKNEEFINETLIALGYVVDFTIDETKTNENLNNAKDFEDHKNDIEDTEKKVINLGELNPYTPSKVDYANKWITGIINNTTSGTPLFDDKDKTSVFLKFEIIAARFAETVSEDEFKTYFPLLKSAYYIVSNAKLNPTTGTKFKYNQKKFVETLTAEYILSTNNISNEFKDYDFFNPNTLDKTGGLDAVNVYPIITLDVKPTRDENGNIIVSDEDGTKLNTILNGLEEGTEVRIRVHTEYKGEQGFSQNKNNLSTIPLVVEVVSGDKVTKVAAINTLIVNHKGVRYNFKGTDWTDILIEDSRKGNSKIGAIKKIYPLLQVWYNSIKMQQGNESTDTALKELLDADSFGILPELIGREKDITSAEGLTALRHVANIIFFGNNTDSNIPIEFNRSTILGNIMNWKDKLFRDQINNIKIRNSIGTDVTKVLKTTVKRVTSGSIVKSINNKGEVVYNNLTSLGNINNLKLYTIQKTSNKSVIENTKDVKDTISKPLGSYSGSLFIGLNSRGTTGSGTNVIPVPVQFNTLNGSKLESNNSQQLIDYVHNIASEIGKLKVATKNAKDNGATAGEIDALHIQVNELENKIRKVINLDFGDQSNKNSIAIDYKSVILNTIDKEGREQKVIYNFYENTYKYTRQEGKNSIVGDITEQDFKNELGKLGRQVDYNSFGKGQYIDVFENKHVSYENYLINSNSILTDVGSVITESGKKIGHFTPTTFSNKGGLPFMLHLDTSNIKNTTAKNINFTKFSTQFKLDSSYDFVFNLFDTFVKEGSLKFNGNIAENTPAKNGYVGYDPNSKQITVYQKWVDYYKTNPIDATRLMVHDIIHALKGTKTVEEQKVLIDQLKGFRTSLIETVEYKELVSKENKTLQEENIIKIMNMEDVEELLTYGLTNVEFAKFLDTIKSDVEGKSESFLTKLATIIRQFFESIGLVSSKLDELNNMFASFMTGSIIKGETNTQGKFNFDEFGEESGEEKNVSIVSSNKYIEKQASIASTINEEITGSPFDSVEEENILSLMSNTFINVLAEDYKGKKVKDIDLDEVRSKLISKIATSIKSRIAQNTLDEDQQSLLHKMLTNIRDNDGFWKFFKINLRNKYGYTINELNEVEEDIQYLEKSWDQIDTVTKNPLHTASDEVKSLINSTPEIDPNSIRINEDGSVYYENDYSTPTGFANNLDWNEYHGKLSSLMVGSLTKEEMLKRLFDFASTVNHPFAKTMFSVWSKLKEDENLLNAWFITFDKAIYASYRDLVRELKTGNEIDIDISDKGTIEYRLANRWTNIIVSRGESGFYTEGFLKDWSKKYLDTATLSTNFTKMNDEVASEISRLYDSIGISVSVDNIIHEFEKDTTNFKRNMISPLDYLVGINIPKFAPVKGYITESIKDPKYKFDSFGKLKQLAGRVKYFTVDEFNQSFTNVNKHLVYSPNNPSFLSNFFKKIASENDQVIYDFVKEYALISSNQHSFLIWGDQYDGSGNPILDQNGHPIKGNGILNYTIKNNVKTPLLKQDAINKVNLSRIKVFAYNGGINLTYENAQEYKDLSKYDWTLQNLLYYFGAGTVTKTETSGNPIIKKHSAIFPLLNPADRGTTRLFEAPIIELNDEQFKILTTGTLEEIKKLPLYNRIYETVIDEAIAMSTAKQVLFQLNDDGQVLFDDNNKPLLNNEIENETIPAQLNYHYKLVDGEKSYIAFKFDENGRYIVDTEKSGNVFSFQNMFMTHQGQAFTFDRIRINNQNFVQTLFSSPTIGMALRSKIEENGVNDTFENRLETFVLNFIRQEIKNSFNNLDIYKDFISNSYNKKENRDTEDINKLISNKAYETAITEYALNSFLFNNEQIRLFYGSVADYKSRVDLNKRGGQLMSNGIPNTERGEFTGATISDIKLKSQVYQAMVKSTTRSLGIDEKKIRVKRLEGIYTKNELQSNKIIINNKEYKLFRPEEEEVYAITSSYLTNDSANAVSIVTLNEFIKRIKGFGLFTEYAPIIDKMTKGTELSREDTIKFASLQKNFYYDLRYDAGLKKMIPVQIKNAEVILTPALMGNLQLKRLNDLMNKHGIVQLNLESAEKVGSRYIATINDENGNLLEDDLVSNELLKAKRNYNYENLRMQLEVPDHILEETNKLGIQIAKKIIENIPDNIDYTINGKNYKGNEIKDHYFEIFNSNIWQSANQTIIPFELSINQNGKIKGDLSLERIVALLEEEGINRNLTKNIIYSLGIGDNGRSRLPIFFSTVSDKWENLLTSIITNGVTTQRFPGVHAAQMSSIFMNIDKKGTKPTSTLYKDLQSTEGINWLKEVVDRKDLKLQSRVLRKGDNKIIEAEVLLPRWSKFFYEEDKVIDINTLSEEIRTMIGYRIPTEAKYSMYVFKVVGFLPDDNGSSIVLPDDFVTQTGSDFDMDTVYTMLYNLNRKRTVNEDGTVTNEIVKAKFIDGTNKTDLKERVNQIMRKKSEMVHVLSTKFSYDTVVDILKKLNDITDEFLNRDEISKLKYPEFYSQLDRINKKIEKSKGKQKRALYLEKAEIQANIFTDKMFQNLQSRDEYKEVELDVQEIISNWSISDQNTREARENEILDIYSSILNNPHHYLESIATSNFKEIKKTTNKLNRRLGEYDKEISNATISGQSEYRERSMQGRDLKSISIAYDRFASIAQVAGIELASKIRDEITGAIRETSSIPSIAYEIKESEKKSIKEKYLKDVEFITKNGKEYAIIKHRFVGNNPAGTFTNINGALINSYSAQTTANILDSVKFGLPKNVNTYTFNIWKMLVAVGSTYDISTFFINQPILTSLTDYFYKNINSIKRGKEIEETKRDYQTNLYKILKKSNKIINERWDNDIKDGKQIFLSNVPFLQENQYKQLGYKNGVGITLDLDNLDANVSLTSAEELDQILKSETPDFQRLNEIENHLRYQLQILETFKLYKEYSNGISDGTKVLNTDKIGAGPSFDVTDNLLYTLDRVHKQGILEIDGLSAMVKIFPDYFNRQDKSVYPMLEQFLKFSNLLSLELFSSHFIGETLPYKMIKDKINTEFNERRYDPKMSGRVTKYLNTLLLNDLPWLNITNDEKERILGINKDKKQTLDISNPDNIAEFESLSTAVQIELIRTHFPRETSVINYLDTKLRDTDIEYNEYHKIVYQENDIPDTITKSFNDLWYSDNIFERIVARNIVKYEYLTNGFTFGYVSASKIIPNNIFYSDTNNFMDGQYTEKGIGLSTHMYGKLDDANNVVNDGRSPDDILQEVSYNLFNVDYYDQILRSNWTNTNIVPNASIIKTGVTRTIKNENGEFENIDVYLFNPDPTNHIIRIPARKFEAIHGGKIWNKVRNASIIKLQTTDSKGKTVWTLYKRVVDYVKVFEDGSIDGNYFYFPIGKLNSSEGTTTSLFEKNNRFDDGTLIQEPQTYLTEIEQLADKKTVDDVIYPTTMDMNMTAKKGEFRDELSQYTHVMQLVRIGARTATTRHMNTGEVNKWKSARIGDYIEIRGTNEFIKVTKEIHPITLATREERETWSKKEGWSREYITKEKLDEASDLWQMEYKYIGGIKNVIKDSGTEISNENQEIQESDNENISGFQGYKGGFENKGKGTPEGDGKDKVMRQIADASIVELKIKSDGHGVRQSSSLVSVTIIAQKSNTTVINVLSPDLRGTLVSVKTANIEKGKVVMLARNGELANKELTNSSKQQIFNAYKLGAEFIVGDMPNVDSQFIDYLQQIDAKFTIYHTGENSRIIVQNEKFAEYTSSSDQRVNNVISAADKFIKQSLVTLATRAKAFQNRGEVGTAVEELQKLGLENEITTFELVNYAKALKIILGYQYNTLLAPREIGKKGGVLTRLEEYENIPISDILKTVRGRKDFTGFMKYALAFLKSYQNITELKSVDTTTFTDEEKIINDLVKEIQKLSPNVSNAMVKFNSLLQNFYEADLINYSSNPEITDGLRRIFDPGDDETYTQYLLDAMSDTNNSFIANLVKKVMVYKFKGDDESKTEIGNFEALVKKIIGKDITTITESDFNKYFEYIDGQRTGKLIQKYDMEAYYKTKNEFFADVKKRFGKGTPNYIKNVADWFKLNEIVTISDEEVQAVINQKKEELSSNQFAKWEKDNIYYSGDSRYIKMGSSNFKTPSDKYISSKWTNIKDDELYKYMTELLNKYGNYFGKENILTKGFIPTMTEKEKKKFTTIQAWYDSHVVTKKTDSFIGENNEMQYILTVPMINFFSQEEPIKFRNKLSNEDYINYQNEVIADVAAAGRGNYNTIQEIRDENRAIQKRNEEYHAGKIQYNLAEILPAFIKAATQYKYTNELKNEVDLALHQLRNSKLSSRTPSGKLAENKAGTKILNVPIYHSKSGQGSNLERHFTEWLEAIFYGNFDIDEGEWTKISKILMKYTSAKNMWFNMTAGISNVTIGKLQVKLERVAGWYFTTEDMRKSDLQYISAIPDIFTNLGNVTSNNLINAIIKKLDISQNTNERDYSTGMLHKQLMSSSSMYFMNDIGEHYMQNIMLLSMMNHHRIIDGNIVSAVEYRYNNYKNALMNILSDEEKKKLDIYLKVRYNNDDFKESKKDYLRDYILALPIEKRDAFIKIKKTLDSESNTTFESYPKFIDAFTLNNAGLAEIQNEIEVNGKKINTKLNENQYELFKNKAIKVNQKCQGIYNTEDANTFSRRAIGKMVIQFKKYIRPGWNKRFGTKMGKSFWTESRDEWDKGMYVSLYDFLKTPFKKKYSEDGEVEQFHKMMGRILSDASDFVTNIGIYWNTLDDFEKGNIRRTLLEFGYLAGVIMVAALLRGLKPDDDKPNIAYDLLVYETDKMYNDLMMFNPTGIGLINEGKKMLSSPAAVQGTMIDMGKFVGNLVGYPFQSPEKRMYQSGVYRGESKLQASTIKLIPIVNKYQQLQRINKFNKYYILFRGQ